MMDRQNARPWQVVETEKGEDWIARRIGSPAAFGVPAPVPPTTPLRYVSFMVALNLRLESEHTGDWHFEGAVYTDPENPQPLPLAGQSEAVDTTPSLRSRGVREMGDVLRAHGLIEDGREVWVADHFRAIADLALSALLNDGACPMARRLPNSELNAWLDTPEQLERLRNDYLLPLRGQLDGAMLAIWDRWLAGIGYIA